LLATSGDLPHRPRSTYNVIRKTLRLRDLRVLMIDECDHVHVQSESDESLAYIPTVGLDDVQDALLRVKSDGMTTTLSSFSKELHGRDIFTTGDA
jgi:hypothetical protein